MMLYGTLFGMLDGLILSFWDLSTHLKIEFLLVWNSSHVLFDNLIVHELLILLILCIMMYRGANRIITASHIVLVLCRQLSL